MLKNLSLFACALLLFLGLPSCQGNKSTQDLSNPCEMGGMPNLFVGADGTAYLSWIEFINDSTDVLAFSTLDNNTWSAPVIVAKGTNWFTNWADFPLLVAYNGHSQQLAAHWLQKSDAGTYDYDIKIVQTKNGGQQWNKPFVPHSDGIAAEHGFVSMIPVGKASIFATWLDGRYTKTENNTDGHEHEGQGGAMTLRGAFFDINGQLSGEIELDHRVCDCCSTSAALTENGVIVAYRDRSETEIRDISLVRQVGNDWTRPRRLSRDNWQIAGCPVNGPKIVSDGKNKVAVAWYTMAQDTPKVKVAYSQDGGANFSQPVRVDDGFPLGRVDIVYHHNQLIISWLESLSEEEAAIRLARVNPSGEIVNKMTLTHTSAARSSGFPVLEKHNAQLIMAWTEIVDDEENTTIRTALVNF